jgi:ribonuclease HI
MELRFGNSKVTKIYTDGASRGNPGLASYAVIIYLSNGEIIRRGEAFDNRTNNQMELLAGCKALEFLTQCKNKNLLDVRYKVPIYSDSQYLVNMFNKGWIYKWEKTGSINNRPNVDLLWKVLMQSYELGGSNVDYFKFQWVRGHNGDEGNELADSYCNELMNQFRGNYSSPNPSKSDDYSFFDLSNVFIAH